MIQACNRTNASADACSLARCGCTYYSGVRTTPVTQTPMSRCTVAGLDLLTHPFDTDGMLVLRRHFAFRRE